MVCQDDQDLLRNFGARVSNYRFLNLSNEPAVLSTGKFPCTSFMGIGRNRAKAASHHFVEMSIGIFSSGSCPTSYFMAVSLLSLMAHRIHCWRKQWNHCYLCLCMPHPFFNQKPQWPHCNAVKFCFICVDSNRTQQRWTFILKILPGMTANNSRALVCLIGFS